MQSRRNEANYRAHPGCRHPVCRRPALRGSGLPPGPPRQEDLDGSYGRWRAGRWSARLARVDGRRDGLPQPPADRNAPMGLVPSRSPSAPDGGAVTATPRPLPARRCGRRALSYAARARGRAARPAAGPPLTGQWSVVLRRPLGLPASAPAAGRVAGPESERQRSDGRAPRRRRVRPVAGRLDRRTESQPRPAGSRPVP